MQAPAIEHLAPRVEKLANEGGLTAPGSPNGGLVMKRNAAFDLALAADLQPQKQHVVPAADKCGATLKAGSQAASLKPSWLWTWVGYDFVRAAELQMEAENDPDRLAHARQTFINDGERVRRMIPPDCTRVSAPSIRPGGARIRRGN